MKNTTPPLLAKSQILKATIAALILGTVLFVAAVLPAEYGTDPLGTGKLLGFDRLYQPGDKSGASAIGTDLPPAHSPLRLEELGSCPGMSPCRKKPRTRPRPGNSSNDRPV